MNFQKDSMNNPHDFIYNSYISRKIKMSILVDNYNLTNIQ